MSRRNEARRKAERRARQAAQVEIHRRAPGRLAALAFLVFVLGFGFATWSVLGAEDGHAKTHTEIDQEVSALLAGIPQHGATLGSPGAPVTLRIYADLECHSVRRFMTEKFPAIVDRFVRSGEVKIEYRSLETDTLKTKNFSRQEIAALAVGRQDGMWNFIETFVREQGQEYSGYATGQFVTGIALQVPGLDRARWLRDREDVQLFDQVALSDHHARMLGMHGTPMFLIGRSSGGGFRRIGSRTEPGPLLDVATLRKGIDSVFGGSAGVAPG